MFIRTCVLVVACLLTTAAVAADDSLESFFRSYLEQRFRLHPMEATELGDHRFDHLLDDLSSAALERSYTHLKETRAALRKINKAWLSRDAQVDYEILDHHLKTAIWLRDNTKPYEENPRLYNQYISDSVFLLLTQSRLPAETNIANAIARIRQVPRIVVAAKQNLQRPPKVVLETAIRQNRGSIGFYEKDIFQFVDNSPQLPALKAEAARAVPVLKDYQEFLEKELLPRASGDWRLGKRKFAKKLELTLDAGIGADDLLKDAEAEYERVRSEMYIIARQLWSRYFPREPALPSSKAGQQETTARILKAVAKEHGKPEELVTDARTTVARIKEFIRDRDLLQLPDPDRCQIIEMPEFQRGNSVAYLNGAPPLDPDAPSMYAISPPGSDWEPKRTQSLLEEYNRHMLQILTIHEAYPGHYVQLEYSSRSPSLIRRVLQSGVMIEGWAVYTEQMLLDQGYGFDDLALRLTQLKFYLRAVANAILDHKLHASSMSDEEAMTLMVNGAFQAEEEARQKLVRAKQTSVQLSTYFTGRMAMVRLREKIQHARGASFQLGRYHEAVLKNGSVPVKYLPELVERTLAAQR